MNKRLLLTVLGDDRHGLVESLSETIKRYKGNWLESRLCHLEGKFAGMVSLEVEGALKAHLISGLKELGNIGLNVTITDLSDPTAKEKELLHLHLLGNDKVGIIHEISSVLAKNRVNVEEIRSRTLAAPMSGGELFEADVFMSLPEGASIASLQSHLEAIGNDLMVDIELNQ